MATDRPFVERPVSTPEQTPGKVDPSRHFFESLKFRQIWKSVNKKTSDESVWQNYSILHRIFDGGYGSIFLAERKEDKLRVAIKIVPEQTNFENEKPCREIEANHPWLAEVAAEINNMIQLNGVKGVIGLLEAHVSMVNNTYILVEETSSNYIDMFEYLCKRGRMVEPEARHFFVQLVEILKRIYQRGFIYVDLKDENILIDVRSKEIFLCDLGGAQKIKEGPYHYFNGTPCYCPPEWARYRRFEGMEIISWGLGVLLVIMTTGCSPFQGKDHGVRNVSYILPTALSSGLRDLISRCLCKNATRRPSIDAILDDPWTKGDGMDIWSEEINLEKKSLKSLNVALEEPKTSFKLIG